MRLKSNFRDSAYDWAFDGKGPVFERISGNVGPIKREQFRILEAAGFKTPPHGLVGDIHGSWWEAEKRWIWDVVAYEDEQAHCTEGKRVVRKQDLKVSPTMGGNSRAELESRRLYDLYCSAFVGFYPQLISGGSVSWRRLQIGPHVFWLEYTSKTSWMSNDGDGDVEVIGYKLNEGFHQSVALPLWAADFVLGKEMYGVDFNTAPGIKGSGVEKILSGDKIVKALEGWYDAIGRGCPRQN